jgi:hypothetical protein
MVGRSYRTLRKNLRDCSDAGRDVSNDVVRIAVLLSISFELILSTQAYDGQSYDGQFYDGYARDAARERVGSNDVVRLAVLRRFRLYSPR